MIGPNVPTIRSVVNGTTLATTLTGLNPYTQYSCYVTANTSVGQGSSSTILTAQTPQSGIQVFWSMAAKDNQSGGLKTIGSY